jgi:hypothetical protein
METKNSTRIIPLAVAIFVFLLLIFASGYAYYVASITASNVTNISANLPKTSTLDSITTDCGMNITPAMMTIENANKNYTHNCSITVTINGSASAFCTYDILVEERSATNYVKSQGVGSGSNPFEFTGKISGSATTAETQMDTLSGHNILSGETITVAVDNTPVTKTYTITEKWYNLDLNQDKHINKSYYYTLKLANVMC